MQPDFHLQAGMLVQLNPVTVRDKNYAGCVMVVSEAKVWGVNGYVQTVGSTGAPGHMALYHANWEEIEVAGVATWVANPQEQEGDTA